MPFAGSFQHWGCQTTWKLNECWQVQAGLHNGWNALDRVENRLGVGVIAGVKYTNPVRGGWSSFAITTGDEDNNPSGQRPSAATALTPRTRYSWIVDMPLTCRLEYVFHHWLGLQDAGAS